MSSAVLQERRGVRPFSAEAAVAINTRFAFAQRGLWPVEPAFAALAPAPGERAHGVLYCMPLSELAKLKRWEKVGYSDMKLTVIRGNGQTVEAHAFAPRMLVPPRPPSRRYLNLLIAGAEEHGLPAAYIAALKATPTGGWAWLSGLQPIARFERLLRRLRQQ